MPSKLGKGSVLRTVSGAGWNCSRSRGSALPVLVLCICPNSPAAAGPCVAQTGCSGLGRDVHPGYFGFFSFSSHLCLLTTLEKGCKRRSAHGLHGETELLESWAQNLPPAAADVSLQLFMLQMDKMVVSTGQGKRLSPLSASSNLQFMKRRSVSCMGIFVT